MPTYCASGAAAPLLAATALYDPELCQNAAAQHRSCAPSYAAIAGCDPAQCQAHASTEVSA
jgi:hypothetical protein